MTPEQRAAMEARHVVTEYADGYEQCMYDVEDWPCDARRALDGWRECEAERDEARAMAKWSGEIAAAEEALARRLAEALAGVMKDAGEPWAGEGVSVVMLESDQAAAFAVLAAYRERHPEGQQ